MNIQSIYLENWKKFTTPIKIEFTEGINVLYGPNESGKSTLIDSIITTFYSKHNSGTPKIKALKPWGTSLRPKAIITFMKDGEKYKITKAFNEKKSLLEKMDTNGWQEIAHSDQADLELIEVVGGQLKPRNDTNPESWGLGPTLWMAQGQPIIKKNLNENTISSLQTLVGATVEPYKEKNILDNIRARYLSIFTERTKKYKTGCPILKIREDIISLSEELALVEQNKTRKEELIRNIDDNELILDNNKRNLEEASKDKEKLAQKVNEAREHQKNRVQIELEIEGIKLEYKSLKGIIDEIKENKEEISKIRLYSDNIKLEILPLQDELKKLELELEGKITKLIEVNNKIDHTVNEKDIAGLTHSTVMDEQSLEIMEVRFKEINDSI